MTIELALTGRLSSFESTSSSSSAVAVSLAPCLVCLLVCLAWETRGGPLGVALTRCARRSSLEVVDGGCGEVVFISQQHGVSACRGFDTARRGINVGVAKLCWTLSHNPAIKQRRWRGLHTQSRADQIFAILPARIIPVRPQMGRRMGQRA